MVNRLTMTLEQPEYSALLQLALDELRNPSDQARYILRERLAHLGLLPADADRPGQQPGGEVGTHDRQL